MRSSHARHFEAPVQGMVRSALVWFGSAFLPATLISVGSGCGGTAISDTGAGTTSSAGENPGSTSTGAAGSAGNQSTGGATVGAGGASGSAGGASGGASSGASGSAGGTSGSAGGTSGSAGGSSTPGNGASGGIPGVDGGAGCTIDGLACGKSQFCKRPLSTQCGAADPVGTCTTLPQACGDIYAPVCGCDTKTYASECDANSHGVSVASTGACPSSGLYAGHTCVVGGVIYPEGTADIPATDGCNTCSCDDGHLACTKKVCSVDGTCGGLAGFSCRSTEYCAYVEGQSCGSGDASSVCKPRPESCPAIAAPVCGCDGVNYGNSCEAARVGKGVRGNGGCVG